MATNLGHATIPLVPRQIEIDSSEFGAICGWTFQESFVGRLLKEDIPRRVSYGNASIYVYTDPKEEIIGFGTLDVCEDYAYLTGGLPHPHIPLLAVHPSKQRLGHGDSIVKHLIQEAYEAYILNTLADCECHDAVFLEVYESSNAIRTYLRNGFEKWDEKPTPDPIEKRNYFVMVRRLPGLEALDDMPAENQFP